VNAVGVAGWAAAAMLLVTALRQRRRLKLVAEAAHELRGPAAALTFAAASLRRERGGVRWALRLEGELSRLGAGLDDLGAARDGRRAERPDRPVSLERLVNAAAAGWQPAAASAGRRLSVRWDAGSAFVRADRGRLASAFGNLLANAAEHGSGPIEIRAVRKSPRAVRVEVRDDGPVSAVRGRRRRRRDRGHGLRIAERVVRQAGGRLDLQRRAAGTVAVVELPVASEVGPPAGGSSARGHGVDRSTR
jgi:two-component system, OmpR family, sensor histidine kinase MtrB